MPRPARYCPACGSPAPRDSAVPTQAGDGRGIGGRASPLEPRGRPDGEEPREARFLPGAVLAGRYRLVGLLGRGGMGEVYRADDLKLGQPVAIKMLPERLAADPALMARFLSEVRVARQVAHPNVCRVYDVTDADGIHLLSMEFVDGENLGSLLRRIGRLPRDKAVQIARQLCAGLAAMHDRGVLHLDLKPANVMIDGRGAVRITDFGLAGLAADLGLEAAPAGTPAYMPPEQIAGRGVTVRSDLYALGLVLYEMFTGRAAYEAGTLAEMRRLHDETMPATPSSILEDIDPAVERVIQRCIEKDPRDRPSSALAVAVALPGGDPLAAALQAGETPSPEVVAAAGVEGGITPGRGLLCLAGVAAGLALVVGLHGATMLYRRVPLHKPPQALAEAAREIVRLAGYVDPPVDVEYAFAEDADYIRWVQTSDSSPARWDRLAAGRPPGILFWYRQSPRPLVTYDRLGIVTRHDPPLAISGMVDVLVDTDGRLLSLAAAPPQRDDGGPPAPADWAPLLRAAGMDPASLTPTAPSWTPPTFADDRVAWEVPADRDGVATRIEAAAFRGTPVYFTSVGPWTRPERMRAFELDARLRAFQWVGVATLIALALGAALLARHNLRLGRGDRRGALRLAVSVLALFLILWSLRAHHVPTVTEFAYLVVATGRALFIACLVWLVYIALEPYVRRRWPASIVSWSRLLSGRFRDPLVGRDVLIGAAAGLCWSATILIEPLLHRWLGMTEGRPLPVDLDALQGPHYLLANLLITPLNGIVQAMTNLLALLLLRVILRRQWAASIAWFAIAVALGVLGSDGNPLIAALLSLAGAGLLLALYLRAGLLAASVAFWYLNLSFVIALDLTSWYAGLSLFALLAAFAVPVYALSTALAGRPLLGGIPLEA